MQEKKQSVSLGNFSFKHETKDHKILSTVDKCANNSLSKTLSDDFIKPRKKIIPTTSLGGLREDLKKIFLPMLIDTIELRHMITTCKAQKNAPEAALYGQTYQSPEDILKKLEQMQNDIEEAQRWCSGIILQIAKGIDEGKEILGSSEAFQNSSHKLSKRKHPKIWSTIYTYIRRLCQKKQRP